MKKRLKLITTYITIAVLAAIFGYTIWIPGKKVNTTSSPFAILLEQQDGSYKESLHSNFTQEGYIYDHYTCNNGSTITYIPATGLVSASFTGPDLCRLYFNIREADFKITDIKLDGVIVDTMPKEAKYDVSYTCDVSTLKWDYAAWASGTGTLEDPYIIRM